MTPYEFAVESELSDSSKTPGDESPPQQASSAPTSKPSASHATFASALIEAGRAFSSVWSHQLPKPLPRWQRFVYALAGTSLWLMFNLMAPTRQTGGIIGDLLPFEAWALAVVFAPFVAWLIACNSSRRSSAARLFLDGLLFPAIVATLVQGSFLLKILEALTGG